MKESKTLSRSFDVTLHLVHLRAVHEGASVRKNYVVTQFWSNNSIHLFLENNEGFCHQKLLVKQVTLADMPHYYVSQPKYNSFTNSAKLK
jgi:hypothetical protein